MATLTINVEQVQTAIYLKYTRARVTVYASGKIAAGETGLINVYDVNRNIIDTASISPAEQQDGTVEVYNKLINFPMQKGTYGTVGAYVEATLGDSNASRLTALDSGQGARGSIFPSADGKLYFGQTYSLIVSMVPDENCNLTATLKMYTQTSPSKSESITIVSNAKKSGVYEFTIPISWISNIPDRASSVPSTRDKGAVWIEFNANAGISVIVGEDKNISVNVPASAAPTLGDLKWKDGLGYGHPGDGSIDAFVQRLSDVNAWVDATAQYGARISKIQATYGSLSASIGQSQGPAIEATDESPIDLGVINDSGDMPLTVSVDDSRGMRTTKSVTLKTAAYNFPSVEVSDIERWDTTENESDDESTTVRAHIKGTISNVNGKNTGGSIKIYSAAASQDPQYQLEGTTSISPTNFEKFIDNSGFSETQAWRFRWVVTDYFGQTVQGEVIIYGARPTIDVSPDGQSIGFWTTAGGRQDVNGNPVEGFYLNGDMTLEEGRSIYGTGGETEGFMDIDKLIGASFNYSSRKFQLDLFQNAALQNDRYLAGYNAAGALIRLLGVNTSGQVELNWSSNRLGGRVMKLLWSGSLSQGGSVTIADLPYYRIFLVQPSAPVQYGNNGYAIMARGYADEELHGGMLTDSVDCTIYALDFVISGTKLTYNRGKRLSIISSGLNTYTNVTTIGRVYGLI